MIPKRIPRYVEMEGLRLTESYLPEVVRSAMTFKPTSNDVIVASYPKCRTTWMCQMVKLVLDKGEHSEMDPEAYFNNFPYLDMHGVGAVLNMSRPGCLKTHLPFDLMNFSEDAKYIYVTRHPRDFVVSFFHHTKFFPAYRYSDGLFDDYFDLFIEGKVDYGDYFDHLLSWYQQRHKPNILFLTYESMKANHHFESATLKVADFLELELTDAQVDNIVKYSSFEHMKKGINNVFNHFSDADKHEKNLKKVVSKAMEDGHKPVGEFIRKGVVGEGKTMLSEEQEEKLKARTIEKTRGSDVMSLWLEMQLRHINI